MVHIIHVHIIIVCLRNIHSNLPMQILYPIVWHEPPHKQVRSDRCNLNKLPMIQAIFAWAEDHVPNPSSSYGSFDKCADAIHVLLV